MRGLEAKGRVSLSAGECPGKAVAPCVNIHMPLGVFQKLGSPWNLGPQLPGGGCSTGQRSEVTFAHS